MDHEFGSDELVDRMVGWDWYSIQLDDRRELMLYVFAARDGSVTASEGSLIDARGAGDRICRCGILVPGERSWKSPHTGGVYPSGWRVRVRRRTSISC